MGTRGQDNLQGNVSITESGLSFTTMNISDAAQTEEAIMNVDEPWHQSQTARVDGTAGNVLVDVPTQVRLSGLHFAKYPGPIWNLLDFEI